MQERQSSQVVRGHTPTRDGGGLSQQRPLSHTDPHPHPSTAERVSPDPWGGPPSSEARGNLRHRAESLPAIFSTRIQAA